MMEYGILYFLEVYDFNEKNKLIGRGYIIYTDDAPFGPYLVDLNGVKLENGWYNLMPHYSDAKIVQLIETVQ